VVVVEVIAGTSTDDEVGDVDSSKEAGGVASTLSMFNAEGMSCCDGYRAGNELKLALQYDYKLLAPRSVGCSRQCGALISEKNY
jgi:hypothetical protein